MPDFTKYHAYCDESCTQARFTVVGLILCEEKVAIKFEAWLKDIAQKQGLSGEVKWTKAKKHNVDKYKIFAESFFKDKKKEYAKFHSIIIDNSQMNHKLHNEGDKEIGFNKMIFQLLFGLIRKYRSRPRFYVYLDDRTTQHTPEKMRKMLNAKAQRDLGISHNPFRSCQFRDSKSVRMIQLVDLLCGAIGYAVNQKAISIDAAPHKIELMNHIAKCAGRQSLAIPTRHADDGFDLWHIDLRSYAKGVRRT